MLEGKQKTIVFWQTEKINPGLNKQLKLRIIRAKCKKFAVWFNLEIF